MKKVILPALLFALALPAPASAATPQENLDCAIWAAAKLGETDDKDAQVALGYFVSWFAGLYEGATGHTMDEAFAARTRKMTDAELAALEPVCLARGRDYGKRLTELGDDIKAQGE